MESLNPLLHSITYMAGPSLVAIILNITLCLATLKLSRHKLEPGHTPLIIALCFLGTILGVIAGGSATPLGQSLVTGILGIIATFLTYLLGKESAADWRSLMPFAMIALLVAAFAGLMIGGNYKAVRQNNEETMAQWQKYYEVVMLPICTKELALLLDGRTLPENYISQCEQAKSIIEQ
ncbi:hypothetical protein [Pseudomonas sp. NFACC13-1]|uniref:hypothetical protein n=1 Tax=Pseudomonas sp. NFACC13-1 TaxID=1566245 RepID=UPI000887CC02|nr:hypothetical protein [Pseudomonas sp. NFACC13-1]SDB39967.1 hypothetical protein SAMN03159290_02927 [Pseudomonas sp. NFACC13-1]